MIVEYASLNNENIGNYMTDFIENENRTGAIVQKESEVLHFFATVEFGVLSKNCKNYGICRLNPRARVQKIKKKGGCKCATHIAHITYHHERHIEMIFQKSNFKEQCRQRYFASDSFKVDEDFLTSFRLDQNSEELSISIKKGKYPIIKTSESYHVRFIR